MPFSVDHAMDLLRHAHSSGRMPHALLLTGAESETNALALSLAVYLCGARAASPDELMHPNCRVLRPSSKLRTITIDSIRSLDDFLTMVMPEGETKLVLVLEADRLSEDSANAFLKTLEEPPPQSLIVLSTELPDSLLPTIRSRCIRLGLAEPDQEEHLSDVQRRFLPVVRPALSKLGSDVTALALRSDLQDFLSGERAEITDRITSALRAEAKSISEGTGVSDWENRQKEVTAAMIETEYLACRSQLLDLLFLCLGQAVLIASHAKDVKPLAPEIETVAQRVGVPELVARMHAVDALRKDLSFNVSEPLALDARLSQIIGSSPYE